MAVEKRHYHAYYGIGRVFEKQGNTQKALIHFETASQLNPTNPVLICWLGTLYEKEGRKEEALAKFVQAVKLSPRSEQFRYKKAKALMSIGAMSDALKELLILKDLAPDFAMVHFLLGELYKSQKEKGLAVRHFTIALNLDPKASQRIKEAMLSLDPDGIGSHDRMRTLI